MPDFGLEGQVCLVTGAARGIGRAIAVALAEAGARVALGLRDAATGGELAEQIGALPLQMDVTDLEQVERAVAATRSHFGRLDVLVNNAGIGPPETPAEDVSVSDFDDTVALNLKGTFFASQAAGRVMIEQGSGRIVNLSSQAGFVALPGEAVYCMTKAAVSHLTQVPRRRVGPARDHASTRSRRPSSPRPGPSRRWRTRRSARTWRSASPRCTGSARPTTSRAR